MANNALYSMELVGISLQLIGIAYGMSSIAQLRQCFIALFARWTSEGTSGVGAVTLQAMEAHGFGGPDIPADATVEQVAARLTQFKKQVLTAFEQIEKQIEKLRSSTTNQLQNERFERDHANRETREIFKEATKKANRAACFLLAGTALLWLKAFF
jgi:hypothetical protein